VVYVKIEATNPKYGLAYTNTQYISVTEITSEIEEIIATQISIIEVRGVGLRRNVQVHSVQNPQLTPPPHVTFVSPLTIG